MSPRARARMASLTIKVAHGQRAVEALAASKPAPRTDLFPEILGAADSEIPPSLRQIGALDRRLEQRRQRLAQIRADRRL